MGDLENAKGFVVEKEHVLDLPTPEWTDTEENNVRRKIDLHLLPILFILFLLCFVDRTNVGNARIQGMEKDLGIHGKQFNFGLTIFYIIYILVEIPSNMILRRVGGRTYLPLLVVGFGVVSMCTAFIQNYSGFLACRFFLGFVEGGVLPGISYFLTTFYRRTELLVRLAFIIMGAAGAGAFGGLLAAGLVHIPRWGLESSPIYGWRNIFFFEGILSILTGFAAMAMMPESPQKCQFLSDRERKIAVCRVNAEQTAESSRAVSRKDVQNAIFSVTGATTALLFLLSNVTVQSFSLFLPTILHELGWTSTHAQLMSVPPYVVACLFAISMGWLSDRCKRRGAFVLGGSIMSVTGYALLLGYRHNNEIRYGAVFLACAGSFQLGPTVISWGLNNAQGQNLRAMTSAFIVGVGNLGAIVATWSYLPQDAPSFPIGHSINIGAMSLTGIVSATLWLYLRRCNQKRAAKVDESQLQHEGVLITFME